MSQVAERSGLIHGDQWFSFESFLGSSSFSEAMGLQKWGSVLACYEKLLGIRERDSGSRIQFGNDHERDAVDSVEYHTGMVFHRTGDNQHRKHFERYSSLPDGYSTCDRYLLEVKCRTVDHNWESEQDFAHYMPQIQGALHIHQRDVCVFGAWRPEETRIWLVPRCYDYFAELDPLLTDFIRRLDWQEPPPKRQTGKKDRVNKFKALIPKCERII